MAKHDRIAIANVGWSELYEGDAIVGDHAFLRENGWGAERYNFVRADDGQFHVYVRPVGATFTNPNPRDKDGWLIVFVSKRQGKPGLYIVGWFEDATFLPHYIDRPEYGRDEGFPLTPEGTRFQYDVTASEGVRVPEQARDIRIETTAMRRTSIMYLRGHGRGSDAKEALAKSVLKQIRQLRTAIKASAVDETHENRDDGRSPTSADTNRRIAVEARSMDAAKDHFEGRGYKVKDVSREKHEFCDLVAIKERAPRKGERLCIEVKGTQADRPRFLMSRRERRFMEDPLNEKTWRLVVVTSALTTPKLAVWSVEEALKCFEMSTFTWFGEEKR